MDIHRCRFVAYPPQSINALAFSHSSNPQQKSPVDLRLALGRENGDIELWNPRGGNWLQERIFRGSKDRTIEQLAWTQDLLVEDGRDGSENGKIEDAQLRLFSSGGSSAITEWDLNTGKQKRHAEGNFGDIWCFAAQPQWKRFPKAQVDLSKISAAPSQYLAAGCSDGTIILFSTADDELKYDRVVAQAPNKKHKVISITWLNRNTIVAGFEQGMIRVIDIRSRAVLRTMSLGKSADGGAVVVWVVRSLPNGTLLSGDSSGELKIWDAKNLSLVQRLKAHEADILDITTSFDGNTIYSCGVDRRTVAYRPVAVQTGGGKKQRWEQVMHRRFHKHDVKSIASFESKDLSFTVSGGMDTVPTILPFPNWETRYHRTLPYLPQKPQFSCSATARLMLTWWERDMFIWHLPSRDGGLKSFEATTMDGSNHRLLARLQLSTDEYITSARISQDGGMIVVATSIGVKLFQTRKSVINGEICLRTRQVDLPNNIQNFGAFEAGFSPDDKWIYTIRQSNVLSLAKILPMSSSKEKPSFHDKIVKLSRSTRRGNGVEKSRLGSYSQTISCVAFSSDSRILVTGDLSGSVDAWVLQGHENFEATTMVNGATSNAESDSDSDSDSDDETDSSLIHGQKWIRNPSGSSLPQLDSAIIALSFRPATSTPTNNEVEHLHATRHNPNPISHEVPTSSSISKVVVVTQTHQLIEFDVLESKLSAWSRKNPSSLLPLDFTRIKDRVMGMFWDINEQKSRERLWLYGTSWLFQLDLSHNLDVANTFPVEKVGKLGKYDVLETTKRRAITSGSAETSSSSSSPTKKRKLPNTGAGDEMRRHDMYRSTLEGIPEPDIDVDMDTGLLSPISDVATEAPAHALALLRRSDDTIPVPPATESNSPSGPAHWHTFQYRSIFAAGIIGTRADTSANIEVVIVERPMYDVDLLPRFDGRQDWDT